MKVQKELKNGAGDVSDREPPAWEGFIPDCLTEPEPAHPSRHYVGVWAFAAAWEIRVIAFHVCRVPMS
jgi:hypothetical protein